MSGGRDTVAAPRGVGWRSALAAVYRVYYNRRISKYPFRLHHLYHHHHYRAAPPLPSSIIYKVRSGMAAMLKTVTDLKDAARLTVRWGGVLTRV